METIGITIPACIRYTTEQIISYIIIASICYPQFHYNYLAIIKLLIVVYTVWAITTNCIPQYNYRVTGSVMSHSLDSYIDTIWAG